MALAAGACRLPRESQTPRLLDVDADRGHPVRLGDPTRRGRGTGGAPGVPGPPRVWCDAPARTSCTYAEFELWGQPLRQSVVQVLARNLEILVPGVVAVSFPWKGPQQDLANRVVLDGGPLRRRAGRSGGHSTPVWVLHRGMSKPDGIAGGRTAIRVPVQGDDYPAIVNCHEPGCWAN